MNKKALYESIMRNVSHQVKKALNEASDNRPVWPYKIPKSDIIYNTGNTFESITITVNIDLRKALSADCYQAIKQEIIDNIATITFTHYDDGNGDGTYSEIDSVPEWLENISVYDWVEEELYNYIIEIENKYC